MRKKFLKKLFVINILTLIILNYGIVLQKNNVVYATDGRLESKFSLSDVIPENTKLRDQKQTPWCLSFSTMATLESTLAMQDKRAGKPAKEYDFSEEHMAYSTQDSSFKDGKTNKLGLHKSVNIGTPMIAMQEYLTNGMGVVNEKDFPFDNSTDDIDISKLNKNISANVLDTFVFPQLSITDTANFSKSQVSDLINEMKVYIKNYGGITTNLATGGTDRKKYMNWTKNCLYNPEEVSISSLDHAVCIIGWDDNYSKDNFNSDCKPKEDGAWITKNSWSNTMDFGDVDKTRKAIYNQLSDDFKTQNNLHSYADITDDMVIYVVKELYPDFTNVRIVKGVIYADRTYDYTYMYVSYETPSIYVNNVGITRAELGKNYDNLYQYDEFGPISYFNFDSSKVYLANVFNRDKSKNEELTRVSIYSPKKQTYQIYVNPNNSNKTMSDLQLVTLAENNSTSISLDAGFHTLELKTPLTLKGSNFVVVLKSVNDSENVKISLESKTTVESDPQRLLYNVAVEAGQSFYSFDDKLANKNWIDMINFKVAEGESVIPSNANIKAYTKEIPKEDNSNKNTISDNKNTTNNNTTDTNKNKITNITNVTSENNNTDNNETNNTKNINDENAKKALEDSQNKVSDNEYVTTQPKLVITNKEAIDTTVATKSIPKTGENKLILYIIILFGIIAIIALIRYFI